MYDSNTAYWKSQVDIYTKLINVPESEIRNVMDMNAGYGGLAAALDSHPVWVMNVVPITMTNTLKVIYDRGLLGLFHDW